MRQRERPGCAADADPDIRPADRHRDQHGDAGAAHGDRDPADCDGHSADGNADQRSADRDPCSANSHSDTDGHADGHTNPDLRRAGTGRLQLSDAHADRQPVRTRTGRMPNADAGAHFDAHPAAVSGSGGWFVKKKWTPSEGWGARVKRLREGKLASGLCVYCHEPAVTGSKRCEFHIEYSKRYRRKLRESETGVWQSVRVGLSKSDVDRLAEFGDPATILKQMAMKKIEELKG